MCRFMYVAYVSVCVCASLWCLQKVLENKSCGRRKCFAWPKAFISIEVREPRASERERDFSIEKRRKE